MKIIHHDKEEATNAAAVEMLSSWMLEPGVRNVMLAGGHTPLDLYRLIGERHLPLSHLNIFALDEYVGVPLDDPDNTANLLRRTAVEPWGVPLSQYYPASSDVNDALISIMAHEAMIEDMGGLDVLVLGLGQNGHLGFNEPGSEEDSCARVLALDEISVEASEEWFKGRYAPDHGATVGMKTILAARRIMVLAYFNHKTDAVHQMVLGPRSPACPASLLQGHPQVYLFLERASAASIAMA